MPQNGPDPFQVKSKMTEQADCPILLVFGIKRCIMVNGDGLVMKTGTGNGNALSTSAISFPGHLSCG